MPRDLRDMLDNIESSQNQTAMLQEKIDKLTTLVQRQKRIISDQEGIIEDQKGKISKMSDIPEDILELKVLIGTQRQLLNERELELEYAKGEVAQSQKELELMHDQLTHVSGAMPTEVRIQAKKRVQMMRDASVEAENNKSYELLHGGKITKTPAADRLNAYSYDFSNAVPTGMIQYQNKQGHLVNTSSANKAILIKEGYKIIG